MIGTEGIKELAQLGRGGFQVLKNCSASEIMSKAVSTMGKGFSNLPFDFESMCKNMIFQGINSKLQDQGQQKLNHEFDTTKVIKKNEKDLK